MARRKRKDDEPEWTPPEFDEVGYMRQEIEGARVALVTIAWAFVGALLAVLLYDYVHPVVGFLAGLMAFGALYFVLPILGLPVHQFKRRDWLSHGFTYFFSWLAFWIILLNPPFADHTAPTVAVQSAGSFSGTFPALPAENGTYCAPAPTDGSTSLATGTNNSLFILFRATDNVGVTRVNVTVVPSSTAFQVFALGGRPSSCIGQLGSAYLPGSYAVVVQNSGQSVDLTFNAWDAAGNGASASLAVSVH